MAVIAKHGIWDNSVYPWTDQSASGMMGSIVAEIDGWVSTISSNPSIVANGMVPVKVKGPGDSTNSGVNNGFVYEFPDTSIGLGNDGPTWPTLMVYGKENDFDFGVTDEYTDNGSNGGYGTAGSTPGHSSVSGTSGTAGFNNEAIVCMETVDGEEFIAVGFKLGTSSSQSMGFAVTRDQGGHWLFTARTAVLAYDGVQGYWTSTNGPYDTDPGSTSYSSATIYKPLVVGAVSISAAKNRPGYTGVAQGVWAAKSRKLYHGRGSSGLFGEYLPIGSGEQMLSLGAYSPAVIVPA